MDVQQMPDGSLLMSDDVLNGRSVYRIAYRAPATCHTSAEYNIAATLTPLRECRPA
jgi:hypothetical protein